MTEKTGQSDGNEGSQLGPFAFTSTNTRQEVDRFMGELNGESDRASAVLAAAFLEWRVRQSIKTQLKVWDSNAETIFGTDARPPELGFVHQCRMAYCLGLVGPIGLKDLETIAKIRNRFAHHLEIHCFDADEKMRGWCKALQSPERVARGPPNEKQGVPRQRYIFSALLLNFMLWEQSTPQPSREWALCFRDDSDGEWTPTTGELFW